MVHKKERMGRKCYTEMREGMIQILTQMIQMCSDREVDIMARSMDSRFKQGIKR